MDFYYTVVTYLLAGIFGLCVGSFLNVVIYRVPNGMSLATPSSHCPRCKYTLRWYDNIPVISYLMLGGKCRSCKAHISFRYTAVEIANMLLWLLSVALFWNISIPIAIIAALTSTVFICVFFIDLEHKLVFDRFVIALLLFGVASCFFDPYYSWLSHIIGGVAGFFSFYLISVLFTRIRGKEGLGGGDIKLTGAVGLILGWERLLLSIVIATVAASIVLVIISKRKEAETSESEDCIESEEDTEYPFAPFLTAAFAIALFFGNRIIDAYLSLLGV